MKKATKSQLGQSQPAALSNALYAPTKKLFLLSVKKGEAQMLLLQSSSRNKIPSHSNQDSFQSCQLVSKQDTQTFSNQTYQKETQTNNQTIVSQKSMQKLDIQYGKELQSGQYSQTVESCDMRQARLRLKQQNNLKDVFQKAMASLDRKLSAHDYLEASEKTIRLRGQNSGNNQKENKENTQQFALMEDHQPIKTNQKTSNRQQNHSEHQINMQQGRCSSTEENHPALQELKWQQNLSKESSKTELLLKDQKTKEIVNKNTSISLLSQPLKNRMQQLEEVLVKKDKEGKQTKRVSWESQENNNTSFDIRNSCQFQDNKCTQKEFKIIKSKHNSSSKLQNDIQSAYDLESYSAVASEQNHNKMHSKHHFYDILYLSRYSPNFQHSSHQMDQNNNKQSSQFNHQNQDSSSNDSRQIPLSGDRIQSHSKLDQSRSNSVAAVSFKDNGHTSHSVSDIKSLKQQQTALKSQNTQSQILLQFSRKQNLKGTNPSKYINSLNSSMHYHPAQFKDVVLLKKANPYNPEGAMPTSLHQVSYNQTYATSTPSTKDLGSASISHGYKFKKLKRNIRSAVQTSSFF